MSHSIRNVSEPPKNNCVVEIVGDSNRAHRNTPLLYCKDRSLSKEVGDGHDARRTKMLCESHSSLILMNKRSCCLGFQSHSFYRHRELSRVLHYCRPCYVGDIVSSTQGSRRAVLDRVTGRDLEVK